MMAGTRREDGGKRKGAKEKEKEQAINLSSRQVLKKDYLRQQAPFHFRTPPDDTPTAKM